jgi:hypothetical protein
MEVLPEHLQLRIWGRRHTATKMAARSVHHLPEPTPAAACRLPERSAAVEQQHEQAPLQKSPHAPRKAEKRREGPYCLDSRRPRIDDHLQQT